MGLRRNQVLDLMANDRTPLTGDAHTAADFEAAKQGFFQRLFGGR